MKHRVSEFRHMEVPRPKSNGLGRVTDQMPSKRQTKKTKLRID